MFESMTIELGLDEHHLLTAGTRRSGCGERNTSRPQPTTAPTGPLRRAIATTLLTIAARIDPAAHTLRTNTTGA